VALAGLLECESGTRLCLLINLRFKELEQDSRFCSSIMSTERGPKGISVCQLTRYDVCNPATSQIETGFDELSSCKAFLDSLLRVLIIAFSILLALKRTKLLKLKIAIYSRNLILIMDTEVVFGP